MKKYRLTNKTITVTRNGKEVTLHRIEALRDFGDIKAGDLGGYVESEANLSHDGDCWVGDKARIYDNAKIFGNALVYDNAEVYGNAKVYGETEVFGNAWVYGSAVVYGMDKVCGDTELST